MITFSYHFIYIEQLFTGLGTPSLVRSAMFTQVEIGETMTTKKYRTVYM